MKFNRRSVSEKLWRAATAAAETATAATTLSIAVVLVCAMAFTSCAKAPTQTDKNGEATKAQVAASPQPVPLPPPPTGIDNSIVDASVNPCDDFFQYACGGWLKKTEIPPDRSRWSRGFAEVDERNLLVLKKILEDYAGGKNAPKNPYSKKLGDMYAACMDENAAEKEAPQAVKDELAPVENLKSVKNLPALIAQLALKGTEVFFNVGSLVDMANPDLVVFAVDQGGLGLPDRDYYLKTDKSSLEILEKYTAHIAKMLELTGTAKDEAARRAKDVLDLETRLAKISMARVDRRNLKAMYHRLERKGLEEKSPGFAWNDFFKSLGYPNIEKIDVRVPPYVSGVDGILANAPLDQIESYLSYHVVSHLAPFASKALVDENFAFYGTVLSGQPVLAARWKRCVGHVNQYLGFALGRAFADLTYGADGKKISQQVISQIEKVFTDDLESLTWMDAKTKKEAMKKIHRVVNMVGFPKKIRNYSTVKVDRHSLVKSVMSGEIFNTKYDLNKIGKPADRTDWVMLPSMVNAYYDPQFNQMVFPAGILQPPFFYKSGEAPVNYGAIGLVMGHELTHGFDDQGRGFDAKGRMIDWWDPKASQEFDKRAQCVADQYDKYAVGDSHVNGKLTVGENIADQGGAKLAFNAWLEQQKAEKAKDRSASSDGSAASAGASNDSPGGSKSAVTFTEAQKFWMGYAQSWCTKTRPQAEKMLLMVDVHSPPKWRVNGVASSSEYFQQAFQCKTGSPMAPALRCNIW